MKVFYSFCETTSDAFASARTNQQKISNKKHCLELFLKTFPMSEITLFVDAVTDSTMDWLKTLPVTINTIVAGTGAKAFRVKLEAAATLPDHEIVLFQEDDYLYLPEAEIAMIEALQYAHYVTGYLHPDKFILPQFGGNPFVTQQGVSEQTRVIQTRSHFWMMTNSTTATFATTAKMIKEDMTEWLECIKDNINIQDFTTFLALRKKGRALLMPIPTLSTHALRGVEAPLIGTGITSWESL